MCGIAGLVDPKGVPAWLLRQMTGAIVHRGPDDEGFHLGDGVGLGMRRLSIIDVEGGRQPIANEDGTVQVVLNGEIYNYRELAKDLACRGHHFATRADTEVVVHAYEQWGDDAVLHLWGMFAFAVWDSRRRRLLIARDRLGKKPLYWARAGGRFAFASELKSLRVVDWIDTTPDPVSLQTYLAVGFIPAPATIFRGVSKLRAGEAAVLEDGGLRQWIYWDVPQQAPLVRTQGEAVEAVAELLSDSVRRRLQSDVPVGALLSSGIDSSVVTAVMVRHARTVDTFTVGFREPEMDETGGARQLAARLGTRHHELVIDSSVADVVERLVWHLDEPLADNAAIPTYLIAQVASRWVKVVLTGEGGDEAFGGYRYYRWEALAQRYRRFRRRASRSADAFLRMAARASGSWKLERFLECADGPDATGLARWQLLAPPGRWQCLLRRDLTADLGGSTPLHAYVDAYERRIDDDRLNRLMYVDTKVFLADDLLTKVDRTTMAHSLEARTPYLDHRLIELLASLPSAWKFDPWGPLVELLSPLPLGRRVGRRDVTKPLLRSAAARWLPRELLQRPKRVFANPIGRWLREDLLTLSRDLFRSAGSSGSDLLDPQVLEAVHQRFLSGDDHLARLIWSALVLELWARSWRDGPGGLTGSGAAAVREA